MSDCTHDLSERETMVADGYCPVCMAAYIDSMKAVVDAAVVMRHHLRTVFDGVEFDKALTAYKESTCELALRVVECSDEKGQVQSDG